MRLMRRVALATVILLLVIATLVWWNKPRRIDMATYAPANSLVYLESNSLGNVATTITRTDAWKTLSPSLGTTNRRSLPWFARFAAWTGIGPIQTVVAARAQVAVVILDLGTSEEGDMLKVRPEAAILIETHTSARRIKPAVEQTLKRLAEGAYGTPAFRRASNNGVEYMIWTAPTGSRQIVATVADSLVIIGNNEAALDACLAVRRGQRASIQNDPELQRMRRSLASDQALAFGFVSSANAARLAAVATPLLFGRRETDRGFDRLISSAAAKIVGTIGWSSFQFNDAIEDRYLFTLEPSVMSRLRPAFDAANGDPPFELLPDRVYSISEYKFEDPLEAWESCKDAALSRLDALSAVVVNSLLKSALLTYGVDDPEKFLTLVGPKVLTVRLHPAAERSVLVAAVRNEQALQQLVTQKLGGNPRHETFGTVEILQSQDEETAAAFVNGYLLMGPPAAVRDCVDTAARNPGKSSDSRFRNLKSLGPSLPSAVIVTYTNDSERVRNFISAIARASSNPGSPSKSEGLEQVLVDLPYSVTETSLGTEGIERRTRSPLGQFSAIVALLFPGDH